MKDGKTKDEMSPEICLQQRIHSIAALLTHDCGSPPTSLVVADTLLRHSRAMLCCAANWLRGCSDTPYFRVAVLLLKQREPVRTSHLHREVCLFSLIGSYH